MTTMKTIELEELQIPKCDTVYEDFHMVTELCKSLKKDVLEQVGT